MVFYRKYRPQIIDDLDNAAVRETLTSVLKKSVPHAFLFTGPKGLGKTSTARILAKAVNCTDKKVGETEPCNLCDSCISITGGTSIDILEIDAASNRGIDEIRDLKEKIRLSPISSIKKVYIIDEVHMLTTEAFNALLKTLEEPPEHAMFILCTTESQKVPSTILSRCFHISFQLATPDELVRSFNRIIKTEKAEIDSEALLMIAMLADGGFRDGAKMLEEIITLAGDKKVTKEFIEEKFKVSSIIFQVAALIQVFKLRDAQKGLQIIAELSSQGVDMKHFIQKVMEALHEKMLTQINGKAKPTDVDFTMEELKILFQLLSRASGEMKYAVLPQLPLELAVLEWTGLNTAVQSVSTTASKTKSEKVETGGATIAIVEEDVTINSMRKQVGDMKRKEALYGVPKKDPNAESDEVKVETTTVELMHTSGDGEATKEWLDLFWKNLINEMKNHNHTVAGLLRGCVIKSYSKQHLIIEAGYQFHKERLDDMKNRDELLRICKALTGNEMEIQVELRKQ
jgi:DNA polymerase-3 subunit gamma/tau